MEKMTAHPVQLGRRFMGRLPHGEDIVRSIENFCREQNIQAAEFSLIGAVTTATIGAYDQKQQVYISFEKQEPLEIMSCIGNISMKEGAPFAHAHIVLGDEQGNAFGGHLFSDTLVFAGEIYLQELTGAEFNREYDDTTGLMLWNIPSGG